MRIPGASVVHVAGWGGGLFEDAEPDLVDPRGRVVGTLDDGLNLVTLPGGRLKVRGGSEVVQTFAAVGGQAISDVLNLFRFTPTGALAVAHTSGGSKHYAYALADTMAFALPVGAATEAGSRVDLTWNTATAGRPVAAELFERLYLVDGSLTNRRELLEVKVSGGALVTTKPTYDLDGSGGAPGAVKGYTIAAFNGVLFVAGWQDEVSTFEPAVLRHSFLGVDPVSASGFDPDAFLLVGAKGQAITALSPGNNILLVAKEHELYRITGAGRAVAGWQYPIAPLDNTLGLGCTNPYAVAHAAGFWYGIGRSGPWRSDGASVELLRRGRDRSWGRVDSLGLATVVHDPERHRVLFGFYETGQPSYDEAPFSWWKWDVLNERWDVSDRFGRSFHNACAVPFGASQAAAGPPTALAQSFAFGHGDFGATVLSGSFTIGDAGAETEIWLRHASQSDVLTQTLPAGVARFTIDGVVLNWEVCYVKARHKKAGVYSDFTGEIAFYPRLRPPSLSLARTATSNTVSVTNYADNSLAQNLYADGGAYSKTWLDAPPGASTDTPASLSSPLTATIEEPDLVGHAESAVSSITLQSLVTAPAGSTPSPPSQSMASDLLATAINVLWQPHNTVGGAHELQYRVTGSGSGWTTAQAFTQSGLGTHTFQITGLTASTKYDVRVTLASGTSPSAATVMYTKIAAPTIAVAQGGAATPDVDITVTVPTSAGGYDVRVYSASNAGGTPNYNQLHAAQSAGAHVYNSTAGTCGVRDKYYAAMYNSTWPADWRYSDLVSAEIANPCA